MVEGYLSGAHRSPWHGFSVEFAQHREYVFGDDLRHLDWKIWGRTDRLYIKQYDAETNFECVLVLDASGSMGFGSGPMTKLEYAKHCAAALAYLVIRQRDAVGLHVLGSSGTVLQPSTSPSRLKEVLHYLEQAAPGGKTALAEELFSVAERRGRRKVVVVLSDFVEEEDALFRALGLLGSGRHDVLLVHLLDPAEVAFPFRDFSAFEGLEGEGVLRVEPSMLRQVYLEELNRHSLLLKNTAAEMNMDYLPLVTDRSLAEVLSAYLVSRSARR